MVEEPALEAKGPNRHQENDETDREACSTVKIGSSHLRKGAC